MKQPYEWHFLIPVSIDLNRFLWISASLNCMKCVVLSAHEILLITTTYVERKFQLKWSSAWLIPLFYSLQNFKLRRIMFVFNHVGKKESRTPINHIKVMRRGQGTYFEDKKLPIPLWPFGRYRISHQPAKPKQCITDFSPRSLFKTTLFWQNPGRNFVKTKVACRD